MRRRPVLLATAVTLAAAAGAAPALATATTGSATPSTLSLPPIARVCALAAPGHVACSALINNKLSRRSSAVCARTRRRHAVRLRPEPAAVGVQASVAAPPAPARPWRSSTRTTTRTPPATSPSTAASTACRPARSRAAASARSTRPAAPRRPRVDTGWAQEESLDIDMVSAICPNCTHPARRGGSSATDADLEAAENEAAKLGATEISNSYGGSEASSETSENSAYNHPGIAITASAGDSGYGVEFPAAVPSVTSVGGTSLSTASNARGWTETVWGSGATVAASTAAPAAAARRTSRSRPGRRTPAAPSAPSPTSRPWRDPNTGVAVYDSTADSSGNVGWLVFGGTSVSSPIIASVYALAGNAATIQASTQGAWYAYATPVAERRDVAAATARAAAAESAKKYLCTAQAGYDGPTGLGTPNGTGASDVRQPQA